MDRIEFYMAKSQEHVFFHRPKKRNHKFFSYNFKKIQTAFKFEITHYENELSIVHYKFTERI